MSPVVLIWIILLAVVAISPAMGWLLDKAKIAEQKHQELINRLEKLEDRFYNPANYNDAFFRPVAKRKDNCPDK